MSNRKRSWNVRLIVDCFVSGFYSYNNTHTIYTNKPFPILIRIHIFLTISCNFVRLILLNICDWCCWRCWQTYKYENWEKERMGERGTYAKTHASTLVSASKILAVWFWFEYTIWYMCVFVCMYVCQWTNCDFI